MGDGSEHFIPVVVRPGTFGYWTPKQCYVGYNGNEYNEYHAGILCRTRDVAAAAIKNHMEKEQAKLAGKIVKEERTPFTKLDKML